MVDGDWLRLTKWSEAPQIADYGAAVIDYKDTSWLSAPHVMLRLIYRFFIAAVEFVKNT